MSISSPVGFRLELGTTNALDECCAAVSSVYYQKRESGLYSN
jgi:hypothetical protein